jgi:glycosyltransferase involved in cell wall biosynthesis
MQKILYIVSSLRRSGPTTQLYNIIKNLDTRKFDPYLVTLSPEHRDSNLSLYEKLNIHLYSLNLSRLKGFFAAKKRIIALLNEIKPDIIHTQGIRGDILSSKLETTIPRVATIHNFPQFDYTMEYGWVIGRIMCLYHIKALKKMSICIGVSESVTENLKHLYNKIHTHTIRNGVDTDWYYPITTDEKDLLRKRLGLLCRVTLWISSGMLSNRKDPFFLIECWKKSKMIADNHHLVLIGNGELYDECKARCHGYNHIHIVGRVNNVVDYLKASDYVLSASRSEGLPYSILEAMACGLPALLSNIPPHIEILQLNSGSGFCYKLGDEISFMESFNNILKIDRADMKKASLDIILNNLSDKIMSESYQQIYSSYDLIS